MHVVGNVPSHSDREIDKTIVAPETLRFAPERPKHHEKLEELLIALAVFVVWITIAICGGAIQGGRESRPWMNWSAMGSSGSSLRLSLPRGLITLLTRGLWGFALCPDAFCQRQGHGGGAVPGFAALEFDGTSYPDGAGEANWPRRPGSLSAAAFRSCLSNYSDSDARRECSLIQQWRTFHCNGCIF